MYNFISHIICMIFLLSISGCSTHASSINTYTNFSKIDISGDVQKNGIYDISIEYDNSGIGWMAYSRVELPKYVETHIAKSNDHGKTWDHVIRVNSSEHNSHNQQAIWRSETPTLLFDPTDAASRRWKLYSHRYPATPPYKKGSHLYADGWIEYKTANSPQGPWSKPIRLFGSREKRCLVDLNNLHASLADISWYNEMGSIVVDGTIYLSLDASPTANGLGKWRKRRVILIASNDHGKSWSYVGNLTDYDDAAELGYLILTGSSLVAENNKIWLFVSPSGAKGLFKKNKGHDGTVIIEVSDIKKAKLKRDKKGKLVVRKWIKPTLHSGGLSDYDEKNTTGGIIFSQINIQIKSVTADFFQIFNTGKSITD